MIEKRVQGGFELGDLCDDPVAVTGHAFNMAGEPAMLPFCERGLRHERSHPCVVGFVAELAELLLGDLQIGAQRAQLLPHTPQPTFDLRIRSSHQPPIVEPEPAIPRILPDRR